MRTKIFLFVSLGVLLVVAALCFRYMRMHSFSAREKPMAIEAFLARHARSLALPPGVRGLKNPVEVNPLVLAEARDHFADHCATCHGNKGDGKTMINEGLYPPAPDMRELETQNLSDGEIFYIIKNGVRFTGMPGWGGEDMENWKLVAFIRHLPKLSDKELSLMKEINDTEASHEGH